MKNSLELNFNPMGASDWRDWSRSFWRTIEERKNLRWAKSYPSSSEWAARLGLVREAPWHWERSGVNAGKTNGWSILFREIEGPDWTPLNLAPVERPELERFIDLLGSRTDAADALRIHRLTISKWWMAGVVPTAHGYAALIRYLHDDFDLGESAPSKGIITGVKVPARIDAFIRKQAITNVSARDIARRTGCSHTTVNNVLKRAAPDD